MSAPATPLIELNLRRAEGAAGDTPVLLDFIDRLIDQIGRLEVPGAGTRTVELAAQLESYRGKFQGALAKGEAGRLAQACLLTCRDFLRETQAIAFEREEAVTELVDVLRRALVQVAGNSESLETKLLASSERIGHLAELEDIREIRQQIAEEVTQLKQVVAEQHERHREFAAHMQSRLERLQSELETAQHAATLDALTGVLNRGGFDQAIAQWAARHSRYGKSFVLAFFDVDHFKKINDTHGHAVGDRVLLMWVNRLGTAIRTTDLLARYGGDEFVLLISDITLRDAEQRMAALIKAVSQTAFTYDDSQPDARITVTATCGLAEFDPGESVEEITSRADQALYDAKRAGRNCVRSRKKGVLSGLMATLRG